MAVGTCPVSAWYCSNETSIISFVLCIRSERPRFACCACKVY